MKIKDAILIILIVINMLLTIFLFTQFFKYRPLLNDLSKTYLIENNEL